MIEAEVIIIGAGPAGSTCARHLRLGGKNVIILDKKKFPRLKLCAGWVTPKVIEASDLDIDNYPHTLITFNRIFFHLGRLKLPIRTVQYSIRRVEFDNWLMQISGVLMIPHTARHIRRDNDGFIIDEAFRCKYLVGAGGSYCPVYQTFFKDRNPRSTAQQIVCLEQEFEYDFHDRNCHLWFFDHGLRGYSWYVPKGGGMLNVGIGGKQASMKSRGETIHDHWQQFTDKLEDLSLVNGQRFQPKGYQYYLRSDVERVQLGNAFLVGDAAGLATKDMGEGIGPAIESGALAAESILTGRPLSIQSISKYSLPSMLLER